MRKISGSIATYVFLVVLLALLGAITVFLPQGSFLPVQEFPASRGTMALVNAGIMLFLYGGLGWLGLKMAARLGFPDLWDPRVTNRMRFLLPAVTGFGLGLFFIATDTGLSHISDLQPLPHPPFPTSLAASAVAGIGEEILFRLFFVSLWVWVVSSILLKGRWQNRVFWIVALASALVFSASHIPSVLFLYGWSSVAEMPATLLVELLLLNGTLSLVAAHHLRAYGFLASVGVHFWTDVVWHVVWGMA
jgi:hypothetical protein